MSFEIVLWEFERLGGRLAGRLLRNVSSVATAFGCAEIQVMASQPTRAPSFDILLPLLLGAV